jgi:chemotaxis signal transduction protein
MEFSFAAEMPNRSLPNSIDELQRAISIVAASSNIDLLDTNLILDKANKFMSESGNGHVFFECNGKRWGVCLSEIWQILPATTILPVIAPQCPFWFIGAFQIEMRIASLIDLSSYLAISTSSSLSQASSGEVISMDEGWKPFSILPSELAILVAEYKGDLFGFQVARLGLEVTIENDDIQTNTPTSDMDRFIAAYYMPQGTPNPEAKNAQGILNIPGIITAIQKTLNGRDLYA